MSPLCGYCQALLEDYNSQCQVDDKPSLRVEVTPWHPSSGRSVSLLSLQRLHLNPAIYWAEISCTRNFCVVPCLSLARLLNTSATTIVMSASVSMIPSTGSPSTTTCTNCGQLPLSWTLTSFTPDFSSPSGRRYYCGCMGVVTAVNWVVWSNTIGVVTAVDWVSLSSKVCTWWVLGPLPLLVRLSWLRGLFWLWLLTVNINMASLLTVPITDVRCLPVRSSITMVISRTLCFRVLHLWWTCVLPLLLVWVELSPLDLCQTLFPLFSLQNRDSGS